VIPAKGTGLFVAEELSLGALDYVQVDTVLKREEPGVDGGQNHQGDHQGGDSRLPLMGTTERMPINRAAGRGRASLSRWMARETTGRKRYGS
jgi:hypothetical protein